MGSNFEITALQEKGQVPVTVFHIRGDIDTNTYEQLQARAKEAQHDGMRFLLLDLSEVGFISSAGLRALHSIYSMLRESSPEEVDKGLRDGTYMSRHLKLLSPSANVETALKTTGFDMYLEIFKDRQKAIKSFN